MDDQINTNPFDEDDKNSYPAFHDNMQPADGGGGMSRKTIIWLLVGAIVLGCGIVICAAAFFLFTPTGTSVLEQIFPTPTFTPTRTPTSTPTNTPTPTRTPTPTPNLTSTAIALQATDTAIAYVATAENAAINWKVVRADVFDSNKNNWIEDSSDTEFGRTTYEIADGKYRWDVTAHQSFIGWVRAGKKELSDFYIGVDIQQMEGSDTADYGVIFREDDNSNFYYFGINEQGEYVLYLFLEEWNTLIDWTDTDLIKPGEANRLTVIGEGSHFTFFINDQYLTEITDDTIGKGTIAMAIELADENDHAIFEFDNFDLRAP